MPVTNPSLSTLTWAGAFALLVAHTGCAAETEGSSSGNASSGAGAGSATSTTTSSTTSSSVGGGAPAGGVILAGTVMAPGETYVGEVEIEGDRIVCVGPGTTCSDASPDVTRVDTEGVISPGLIDTHNHILFDIFDETDWAPNLPTSCTDDASCDVSDYCRTTNPCACVDGTCKYADHTQWPKEDEYALMLDYKQCLEDASQGKPIWCPLDYDGDGKLKCEMNKWGELKGLVAGTTSIVGLPGNSSGCFGSLSRSIDVAQNDLEDDAVQTSALFPPSSSSADGVCANFTDGDTNAYLIHVGEGVNQRAFDEFQDLFDATTDPGCLYAPQTTITHGTAFTATEFATMAAAGMKLTWSPASNVALYGTTTDIPAALAAGLVISLAPDWSMGGSQNLLDEMRFAKQWSDDNWGGALTNQMLHEMVTENAAAVLGLAGTIGTLQVGAKADIMVVPPAGADAYDAVVAARPADVSLVMVGGVVLYGDPALQSLAPTMPACETLTICGVDRFLCIAESDGGDIKLDQTSADIESLLSDAILDLDGIAELPSSSCNDTCAPEESCYERTVHPIVAESNCPAPCAADEACFQRAMSGNNMFECQTLNACAPTKTQGMAPLVPIVKCQ